MFDTTIKFSGSLVHLEHAATGVLGIPIFLSKFGVLEPFVIKGVLEVNTFGGILVKELGEEVFAFG